MKYGDELYQAIVHCARKLKDTFAQGDFDRALLLAEKEIESLKRECDCSHHMAKKKTAETSATVRQ